MFPKFTQFVLTAAMLAGAAFGQASPASQNLTGSWLITIAVDGAPGPFAIDMVTYDGRGGMTVIPSDKGESPAVGRYQRTGDREFQSTHTHIVYNDKGTFQAIAKVIATQKVNEAGDASLGRYRVEVLDVNGRVLAKITGPIIGKLIVPEPL